MNGALVYALGALGYDFQTEARRDYFVQAMPEGANNPLLADQLLAYLDDNPYEAQGLTWTLNVDATPIYAIQPAGPFAAETYARLREVLRSQFESDVELVSIPGVIIGSVALLSGQVVPVVAPALRGVFDWSVTTLVRHALGPRPTESADTNEAYRGDESYDRDAAGLTDILNRIYFDLRNLGLAAEDRALNFAATNAAQATAVIESATRQNLDLDSVSVSRSAICRPGSDCYDVEISFFNPDNMNVASRIFRFTVDVSDVIPVSVGPMRSWTRRG
jgi:cyanobactin maturation PatA/PatG family protease